MSAAPINFKEKRSGECEVPHDEDVFHKFVKNMQDPVFEAMVASAGFAACDTAYNVYSWWTTGDYSSLINFRTLSIASAAAGFGLVMRRQGEQETKELKEEIRKLQDHVTSFQVLKDFKNVSKSGPTVILSNKSPIAPALEALEGAQFDELKLDLSNRETIHEDVSLLMQHVFMKRSIAVLQLNGHSEDIMKLLERLSGSFSIGCDVNSIHLPNLDISALNPAELVLIANEMKRNRSLEKVRIECQEGTDDNQIRSFQTTASKYRENLQFQILKTESAAATSGDA